MPHHTKTYRKRKTLTPLSAAKTLQRHSRKYLRTLPNPPVPGAVATPPPLHLVGMGHHKKRHHKSKRHHKRHRMGGKTLRKTKCKSMKGNYASHRKCKASY